VETSEKGYITCLHLPKTWQRGICGAGIDLVPRLALHATHYTENRRVGN
jgi:hypothetical protein